MAKGIKAPRGGLAGAIDQLLASNIERILPIPGKRLYKQFVQATHDVQATQLAVMREILDYAADTVIGKEHDFAKIASYEDFRQALPVRDYEDHRPYVNRHARGEEGVLFPGKPLMYNRSSGTTAEPKLLPVTPYAFERTIKNRGKLWLYGLLREFPGIFKGKDLVLVSPAVEGHTEDGTPFGSLSGLVYQNIPGFMKLVHSAPEVVIHIEDYDAKVYTLMRYALGSDVSSIFTGNPATVVNLVTRADTWKQDLIKDIRDGTLKADLPLPAEIRAQAEARLARYPARAALVVGFAGGGGRRPADYWPELKLIHTWKNGNCRLVLPQLEPWFRSDTPILDFGYIASEITATDLIDRENDGSILQVRNAFFEFTLEEEGDSPDRRFFLAHELEAGQRYFIYVTTLGGLYRYDMNDVIEVLGHFNQAPVFRFLYKGKGMTNLQGEKLSEAQFIEAVGRAAQATGLRHDFFLGWANAQAARYDLYIEFERGTSPADQRRFGKAVDEALHEVNCEWEAKRKSDRLAPIEVIPLVQNAFDRYREMRLAQGALSGQLKWLNLTGMESSRELMERIALRQEH